MEGTVQNSAGIKATITAWMERHPGVIPLIVALGLGFLLPQALIAGLSRYDVPVKVGQQQISLSHLIWLGFILVLCAVVIWARSKISCDLKQAARRVLAGAGRSAEWGALDAPGIGAGIVRGLFDLVILLLLQSMLRPPLVAVGSAYWPEAWLDGGIVLIVVAIALGMLFGVHRMSRPLVERLSWVGLDQVMPTAGYEMKPTLAPSTERTRAVRPSQLAPRQSAGPTVAAEAAAGATVATPPSTSEATVPSLAAPAISAAEATVLASPVDTAMPAEFTVLAPPAPAAAAESSPAAADARILPRLPGPQSLPSGAEAITIAPPSGFGDDVPAMDLRFQPLVHPTPSPGEPEPSRLAEATIVNCPSERTPGNLAESPAMASLAMADLAMADHTVAQATAPAEVEEELRSGGFPPAALGELPSTEESRPEPLSPEWVHDAPQEASAPVVPASESEAGPALGAKPETVASDDLPSSPPPEPIRWSARRFAAAPLPTSTPSQTQEESLPVTGPAVGPAAPPGAQIRWSDRTFTSHSSPLPERTDAEASPSQADYTMAPTGPGADQTVVPEDGPHQAPAGSSPAAGSTQEPEASTDAAGKE